MTNNQRPDRMQPADLDDLDNVPTYDPKNSGSGLGKFYERYGRSAPQSIDPVAKEPATEAAPAAQPETTHDLYKVSREPEPTASFDAPTTTSSPYQPATAAADPFATTETHTSAASEVAATTATPVATEEYDEPVAVEKPADARRGTIDLGLMIIRVVIGALLTFMSLRTFFELGGAPGMGGLKEQFASYAMGDILAIAVPTMQLVAGVFLLLGLLTPVAASIATAVTGFGAVHALAQQDGVSLLNPSDSLVLPILLALIAFGLQFTGPGRISLDVARSWARRPLASSWIWAIVGVAGAVAMWWFLAGVNPLS